MTTLDEVLLGVVGPGVHDLDDRVSAFDLDDRVGARGWTSFHLDAGSVVDKASFLGAIADACRFPAWFGHNWDALADALGDLSWAPAEGYVLLVDHSEGLRAGPDWATVVAIFDDAARRWAEDGVPFHVLVR